MVTQSRILRVRLRRSGIECRTAVKAVVHEAGGGGGGIHEGSRIIR
jgi:hypothetical protein